VALFVAIYAVVLAIAAAGGHKAGKEMLMEQLQATDLWGQFQGKSIRESNALSEYEKLEIEMLNGDALAEAKAKNETRKTRLKTKLDQYEKDKEEIFREAKKHEAARDEALHRDPYFDFAEVALQISIVLASVAMLSGKRWAFVTSLVLAVIGVALTLNGYLLLDHGKLLA
jgi:hypothetical protein